MAQATENDLDEMKMNGDSKEPDLSEATSSIGATPSTEATRSDRATPSIGALTIDTTRLPSTPGTPHPTTPATPKIPSEKSDSDTLLDREGRAVADLLTRFKTLVILATEPIQDGATIEVAAAHGLQMEVEGSALVRAAEDLLQLTRELKELWLFGPLRGIKEGEGEGQMDEDSQKVGELVETVLQKAMERPSAP